MKCAPVLRLVAGILCASLVLAAGCSRSPTPRFYTLHSLTDPGTEKRDTTDDSGIAIGVGPIELPEHLNRPQIVTRVNPNEVEFAEFHRWASSLKDGFSSTVARNLSNLLATDQVAVYPWTSKTPVDVQVKIDVIRFDGSPGKNVVLETAWALIGEHGTKPLMSRGSVVSEKVDKNGYEGLVDAQSRAIAGLSHEIARAIQALPRDEPAPSAGGD
jgi:uncharacterized lipoprotein YmbA